MILRIAGKTGPREIAEVLVSLQPPQPLPPYYTSRILGADRSDAKTEIDIQSSFIQHWPESSQASAWFPCNREKGWGMDSNHSQAKVLLEGFNWSPS